MQFEIKPYYRLEIDEKGIRIKSFSKYRGGIEKELSQYKTVDGYLRVKMNNKHELIHRLVAKYCFGPCPDGLVVNHKDCNKQNNYPDNLEYITITENIKHSVINGMHVSND